MTPRTRMAALEMVMRINRLNDRGRAVTFPMHTPHEVTLIRDALVLLAAYEPEESHVG